MRSGRLILIAVVVLLLAPALARAERVESRTGTRPTSRVAFAPHPGGVRVADAAVSVRRG